MNKYKDTRIVTFKEDYKVANGTRVIYAKGSTHAIHKDLVKKLQLAKAQIDVKEFDKEKAVEAAKKRLKKQKEAA